jgi:caffeoyl-CoA O-methyltransferase
MDRDEYLDGLLGEDEVLRHVRERIAELGMPSISIRPMYGRLLTILVAASDAREVLEIGLLGGYSAICLARGLRNGGRVTSLELRDDYAAVAAEHLAHAALRDQVEIRVGVARESLAALAAEGRSFDFVFIDADKESYPHYLEAALRIANPGALIVADNALYHGRVLDPQDGSEPARALREFNRRVMTDSRLTSAILPAYDGLAIARVAG